ncbi:uncharacterized protein At2g33490-like [Tripterygium wilfordii]|uniref:uncharacterized protein At2g33490-like n=1 Tax=Tripterygium wilfordii TaxID=458696 RepID=UPI0018F805C0|nr:uncharacterized protein At2g33490-like [Tripterygium wilfordii]
MKTSLRKLRGFALHRHGDPSKDRTDLRTPPQLDHLTQASQDMEDMRDCYDSLLSAAAATANSAYEFSESLREMGACLLEKTALNDDEESGKVLLMLGKMQFELQKLIDTYRSHIFQTITVPSESLLNELQTVEEMKRQCDEKRDVYEHMVATYREKGRAKGGRGESFSVQQLQAAHEEYDEKATLFVFRLKSLKQGQSRSLLTQAARHHAAQLCFFKKALKSLEIVEPHVKSVTEQQHIDYHFSELEDDDGDDGDDVEDDDDLHDGELSFDYSQKDHQQHDVSTSRNSMEEDITFPRVARLENSKLDQEDITSPHVAKLEASKDNLNRRYRRSFSYRGEFRPASLSAPLYFENKSDPSEKMKQRRPSSTHKFNTYVLPTPVNTNSSHSTGQGNAIHNTLQASLSGRSNNLWHSSPLVPKKYEEMLGNEKSSQFTVKSSQSVLRESNSKTASSQVPPPLTDGLLISHLDPLVASVSKKIKRQAFSGPLMHKPWPKTVTVEHPQMFSGPLLRKPVPQKPSASPKVSPSAFPTFMSSPKISELHELPRPPSIPTSKSSRPKGLVGHSAPLMSKGQVLPQTNKLVAPNAASPLPTPSPATTCSFSIPSSSPMETTMQVPKSVEVLRTADMAEEIASPPLTPISLPLDQIQSGGLEIVNQTVQSGRNIRAS